MKVTLENGTTIEFADGGGEPQYEAMSCDMMTRDATPKEAEAMSKIERGEE